MDIRKGKPEDIPELMRVYAAAKQYMIRNGNPDQWYGGYPDEELVAYDIEQGRNYVVLNEGKICGCFVFIIGKDPTYGYIEDGEWLNDELTYGTIHRIASDESAPGIFDAAVDFCFSKINNLRVDTHEKNLTMQHLAKSRGFTRCGIIYIERDNKEEPRIAYQKLI